MKSTDWWWLVSEYETSCQGCGGTVQEGDVFAWSRRPPTDDEFKRLCRECVTELGLDPEPGTAVRKLWGMPRPKRTAEERARDRQAVVGVLEQSHGSPVHVRVIAEVTGLRLNVVGAQVRWLVASGEARPSGRGYYSLVPETERQ